MAKSNAWSVIVALATALTSCVPIDNPPINARHRKTIDGREVNPRKPGAYPEPEQLSRLHDGMSKDQVYHILGEAMAIQELGVITVWKYGEVGARTLSLSFKRQRLYGFDY